MLEISFSDSFKRSFKKRIKGNETLERKFRSKLEIFRENPYGFLTQGDLAANLRLALSTINNFFNGKNVFISTDNYWQRLIEKHPDIEKLEELIKQVLASPDEIRLSRSDPNVLLFYLSRKKKRWVVAVARRLNGEGFLITGYQANAIKEGEQLWHR
ncbi:hypothetical protein [Aphanothece sacrum]|uniref:Uncharacterized protein n=1 Tax=Aphanothece sacrum FPU1 TaxID=1920663 RepID=A0A401IJX1_APHSA|nr:hypothetical protein [Aphanothece sacrum]GBF81577.1 hypothetical protein AsFPU1_2991 [Aphanothece sacrum FPU1]GBF86966.1 hypothetical protein AsFPU3_4045 [Aphanothece sacrum FPU3]